MTPNPPSNSSPEPQGIRAGFIGVTALLAVVVIAVGFSFYGTKKSFPESAPAVAASSNPANETRMPSVSTTPVAADSTPVPIAANLTDTGLAKLTAQLSDGSLPLRARCDAARALAKLGSETAMTVLKNALAANCPPYLKAAIAQALGECPNPEARGLLNSLTQDKDEITARGAVRGLAARGDADAMSSLGNLLFDSKTPVSVRTEAALSLGDVSLPGAQALLMRAMTEIKDETVVENVLAGLAKRPFAETQYFFNNYLGSTDVPVESKITALEALGNGSGDVTPFLLNYLNNPNAEVRAAVAWSLITAGNESDISPQLIGALKQESDSTVRTRLYQALENQTAANAQVLLPIIQNESDPAARAAALNLLAANVRSSQSPDVQTFFNQTVVVELQNTALNSDSAQDRLASVHTLERAGTPAAIAALQIIAQKSTDAKVSAVAAGSGK